MRPFIYSAPASRVIFGPGVLSCLPETLERLGLTRTLVIATPSALSAVRSMLGQLGSRVAGLFDRPVSHVPLAVAEEARRMAQALGADSCLVIGGGSAIGLGKAVALTSGLPIVAVPTTYSGSEMTSVYGITDGGKKSTGRDPRVLPSAVIYDPTLTVSLPPALSASSGMNSIAHCVEALYAQDGNPVVSLTAEEGIRALASALPSIVACPSDEESRTLALYGAWLAGMSLGSTTMGLHHKVCHVLGGSFDLPHAAMHSIVLPHAVQYNSGAAPEAMARIARALGTDCGSTGLYRLAEQLRIPLSLAEIGMPQDGLEDAARQITAEPYPNPAQVSFSGVLSLLQSAYAGAVPASERPSVTP